jgi:hypothetical protein
VIIDANLVTLIFREPPHEDFLPVFNWLHDEQRDGRLVFGGKLAVELNQVRGARRYLRALLQAGRAILIPNGEVSIEEKRVIRTGLCKSDDPHVIALARISGARTLCSCDKDLHDDFKNRRLISRPRGSVYQNPRHVHLLRHTRSCQNIKSRR